MAVKSNYSGRDIDLLIFQGTAVEGDQKIFLGFNPEGGEVTTGIQKLLQTFTILFLTEKGSVPAMPERGTNFLLAVRLGRLNDESDVQAEFSLAVEAIKELFSLDDFNDTLSDDERLDSAELQSVNIDKNGSLLTLQVKVNSLAGDSRDIFLPIPVPIY
jgi:hypothetical protein